jgi:hypothetical protein
MNNLIEQGSRYLKEQQQIQEVSGFIFGRAIHLLKKHVEKKRGVPFFKYTRLERDVEPNDKESPAVRVSISSEAQLDKARTVSISIRGFGTLILTQSGAKGDEMYMNTYDLRSNVSESRLEVLKGYSETLGVLGSGIEAENLAVVNRHLELQHQREQRH